MFSNWSTLWANFFKGCATKFNIKSPDVLLHYSWYCAMGLLCFMFLCPNCVSKKKKTEDKQSDLLPFWDCNYVSFSEMSLNRGLSKKSVSKKKITCVFICIFDISRISGSRVISDGWVHMYSIYGVVSIYIFCVFVNKTTHNRWRGIIHWNKSSPGWIQISWRSGERRPWEDRLEYDSPNVLKNCMKLTENILVGMEVQAPEYPLRSAFWFLMEGEQCRNHGLTS